jgi:hypothetical protein
MKKLSPGYTRQVVRRFENAVENYAFRGTIPYQESDEAFQAYTDIEKEYKSAKIALLLMIDKLNGISNAN